MLHVFVQNNGVEAKVLKSIRPQISEWHHPCPRTASRCLQGPQMKRLYQAHNSQSPTRPAASCMSLYYIVPHAARHLFFFHFLIYYNVLLLLQVCVYIFHNFEWFPFMFAVALILYFRLSFICSFNCRCSCHLCQVWIYYKRTSQVNLWLFGSYFWKSKQAQAVDLFWWAAAIHFLNHKMPPYSTILCNNIKLSCAKAGKSFAHTPGGIICPSLV